MQEEMGLYDALLTTQDPKPDGLDIPKLYYDGPVLEKNHANKFAIALSFTEQWKEIEIEEEIVTKSQKPVRRVRFAELPEIHFLSTNIDELVEEEDKMATRNRPFPRYAGLDKDESRIATRNRKNVRGTGIDKMLEEDDKIATRHRPFPRNAESSSNEKVERPTKYLNLKGRISKKLLEAKLHFQLMKRRSKK